MRCCVSLLEVFLCESLQRAQANAGPHTEMTVSVYVATKSVAQEEDDDRTAAMYRFGYELQNDGENFYGLGRSHVAPFVAEICTSRMLALNTHRLIGVNLTYGRGRFPRYTICRLCRVYYKTREADAGVKISSRIARNVKVGPVCGQTIVRGTMWPTKC